MSKSQCSLTINLSKSKIKSQPNVAPAANTTPVTRINANKIYNTGGYWYYEGTNNVLVKRTLAEETKYDFWKVPYHNINFDELTEAK